MLTTKKQVIEMLNMRMSTPGIDRLGRVPHSSPTVDEWEELRVAATKKISEELGIEVEVLDDASVEWHYNGPDAFTIGWLETTEHYWTFQQYDALQLVRSAEGSSDLPPFNFRG